MHQKNVVRTLIIAQVTIEKSVSDVVLISTDKAVQSNNIMGASKWLGELCLQAFFALTANTSKTKLFMVHFDNVLN